jgi:hypothetical protein
MESDISSEIDKIKESATPQEPKQQIFNITGGHGASVVGGGNSWIVSFDQDVIKDAIPSNLQIYTFQICVNGEAKSIDVYVAGQPY